jgi:hypothetical protein
MNDNDQVVKVPKSSSHTEVEQLAYLESFDAVVDKTYAFVVYKEKKAASGKWVMRIKGSVTAGTVFDPDNASLKNAFKKAAGHEEPYIVWGFNLQSKEGDPRLVENRVLIDKSGKPSALEIHLITRKADGSARDKEVVSIEWPD